MSARRNGIDCLWPGYVRGIQIDSYGSGFTMVGLNGSVRRIECGDWNDLTDGNMMFVLHGDETEGFYLSIFRESELPW